MKRFFTLSALVVMFVFGALFLGACEEPTPETDEVTVSWYYGSKLLKEEKVEKGTVLESWEPAEEGKTFTGWFREASATEPFDFTKAVEEDTDIFAAFKSDEFVADENEYYLIGAGAADMGKANWDHANAAKELPMVRQEVEGANVYKITIKMYAGDAFQVCYGGSWDGQQGIGIMVGAEYADGVNKYDSTEYTAADKKVAYVKDAEGNIVFEGHDEYNKEYSVWNIFLAEGQDGVYEFTLTTYPNAKAYNTLEYKLIEKVEAQTVTHQMHTVGSFQGWNPGAEDQLMTESQDKATWSGFVTVEAGAELKVYNAINSGWYPGENVKLEEAGTYAVLYTVADNSVKVEKLEYYLVGTLLDEEGNAVNFAVKEGACPKFEAQEDGSYKATFTAPKVNERNDYNWMTSQGKVDANGNPAECAIKVVYGSSLAIKDWYGDAAANGDNWYVVAGTYELVFKDGALTITPAAE